MTMTTSAANTIVITLTQVKVNNYHNIPHIRQFPGAADIIIIGQKYSLLRKSTRTRVTIDRHWISIHKLKYAC